MNTWFLTKKAKLYNGIKKASSINGAGITGCKLVENANIVLSIAMHKAQVLLDQRPQHKPSYTEADRRESGN